MSLLSPSASDGNANKMNGSNESSPWKHKRDDDGDREMRGCLQMLEERETELHQERWERILMPTLLPWMGTVILSYLDIPKYRVLGLMKRGVTDCALTDSISIAFPVSSTFKQGWMTVIRRLGSFNLPT